MTEKATEVDLPKFFAWARPRVYREYEARIKADPSLDPNWAFSDIMQELLIEYQRMHCESDSSDHLPAAN